MPGVLAALLSVLMVLLAGEETYGGEMYEIFPRCDPAEGLQARTVTAQALMQEWCSEVWQVDKQHGQPALDVAAAPLLPKSSTSSSPSPASSSSTNLSSYSPAPLPPSRSGRESHLFYEQVSHASEMVVVMLVVVMTMMVTQV